MRSRPKTPRQRPTGTPSINQGPAAPPPPDPGRRRPVYRGPAEGLPSESHHGAYLHCDRPDLLFDGLAANRAQVELRRALGAAAVVAAGDQRAVHLALEAHLKWWRTGKRGRSRGTRAIGVTGHPPSGDSAVTADQSKPQTNQNPPASCLLFLPRSRPVKPPHGGHRHTHGSTGQARRLPSG